MVVTSFQFDVSELNTLAADLRQVGPATARKVPSVVRKAGLNIRDDWRADAARSRHFQQIGPTSTMDERRDAGGFEVEVGPNRRYRAARLAGIWMFGGANGGGGTGQDPTVHLDKEAPRLADALADLIGDEL